MIEKEALIYLLLIHFGQVIRNKYRTFLSLFDLDKRDTKTVFNETENQFKNTIVT